MFLNKLILAPLTKGGNLPFRRLCKRFGADITISEMAYARFVLKGEAREKALLRRHADEEVFGVQFAVNDSAEAIPASKLAQEMGASFIDINCGCPIHDTTRRGLGAALLRRPSQISKLIAETKNAIDIPITIKIRLGWSEDEQNHLKIAKLAEDAGASAIFVHGRTREQRYSRAADWTKISEVKNSVQIPVIGNGDILTHYEGEDRRKISNVDSLLIARAALIKPWIFAELKEGKTFDLSWSERTEIFYQLASYMKEHFRDDEKGLRRCKDFLTWHFSFFHRYIYLPKSQYYESSLEHPLMQSRCFSPQHLHESQCPEEKLLSSADPQLHSRIASAILGSTSTQGACDGISNLASTSDLTSTFEAPESEAIFAG